MSVARHHAEWLSLIEVSGPFLSMKTLLDAFPQGLDDVPSEVRGRIREAFGEWQDEGFEDAAIHREWVRFVLRAALEFDQECLFENSAESRFPSVKVPEHGEVLVPDLVVRAPGEKKPAFLIRIVPPTQNLDGPLVGTAWKASPLTRMMTLLHGTEIPLGLVTNGERFTLVHAPAGETTTFASFYAHLFSEEPLVLRAFTSLLGARRFFGVPADETLSALLVKSLSEQHEVTDQLGLQVRRAVEILIQTFDRLDRESGGELMAGFDEKRLYESAVTVMMRLVFLFAAEERELLPVDQPLYQEHYAVSTILAQLEEKADRETEEVLERRHDAWSRLLATFRAVHGGVKHEGMRLPAHGGSLFDPDRFPFLEGRPLDTKWKDTPSVPLAIDNRTVLHLLRALQILEIKVAGGGPAEARRLSFRALDVEQIGHVYEGLLDHTAIRAQGPVLGLAGTKNKTPEVELLTLEEHRERSEDALLDFLNKQTGSQPKTLEKRLGAGIVAEEIPRWRVACDN